MHKKGKSRRRRRTSTHENLENRPCSRKMLRMEGRKERRRRREKRCC
jgi:hypothetical protein